MFLLLVGAGLNSVSFSFSFSGVILLGRFLDVVGDVCCGMVDNVGFDLGTVFVVFVDALFDAFGLLFVTISSSSSLVLDSHSFSPLYWESFSGEVSLSLSLMSCLVLVSLSLSLVLLLSLSFRLLSCEIVMSSSLSCSRLGDVAGLGVDAHLAIAEVCFAGGFRSLNSGAFMVYFSDCGDVANVAEVCFAGSFVSINDGFPMV